jgi:membrane protease YdiL (CAAX protease family)
VADALLFLASYVLVCGCGLLLIRRRLRHSGGSTRDLLGLAGAPTLHRWRQGLTGYCALVAIFAVLAILGQASGVGLPVTAASSGSMSDLLRGQRGPAEVAIYLILTCLLAPLAEETIFRGYVYAGLRRALPMPVAIVASAALFAGTHLSLSAGGMLAVAGVGAMLAYLYERTGSLWPGVVAHLAHNLLALSIILAINA